jgi:hypothetical protein
MCAPTWAAAASSLRLKLFDERRAPDAPPEEGDETMKKIQHVTLGLSLSALLALGCVGVAAKSDGAAKQRAISGVVTRIDLRARTVEVREDGSGRIISMYIPDGKLVETNLTMSPMLQIERLLPGMYIRAGVK